jgi:hypothetical protein
MRRFWIVSGATAIILRIILGFFPKITENVYTLFFFQRIRWLLDTMFGGISFPMVYIVVSIFLISFCIALAQDIFSGGTWWMRIKAMCRTLGVYTCFLAATFLPLWGFNYARPDFRTLIQLPKTSFSNDALLHEFDISTQTITSLRQQFDTFESHLVEDSIRTNVKKAMYDLHLTPIGAPRARLLYAGTLLHFNTSGVYFPWTGECNIDAGLHPIQQPFTLAHELVHGFGITDEGACNFIAYIAGHSDTNVHRRYSAELAYWRYVAGNVRLANPEKYKQVRENLPQNIKNDLEDIKKNMNQYADWLPILQPLLYDTFLKTQGVKAGMMSYSEIVVWVHDWRNQQKEERF